MDTKYFLDTYKNLLKQCEEIPVEDRTQGMLLAMSASSLVIGTSEPYIPNIKIHLGGDVSIVNLPHIQHNPDDAPPNVTFTTTFKEGDEPIVLGSAKVTENISYQINDGTLYPIIDGIIDWNNPSGGIDISTKLDKSAETSIYGPGLNNSNVLKPEFPSDSLLDERGLLKYPKK